MVSNNRPPTDEKHDLIRRLVADGEIADALEEADARDLALLFELGEQVDREGDYRAADQIFHRITELDPQCVEAWVNRGVALGQQSKYDRAMDCLDEAIRIDSSSTEAHANKGITLLNTRRYSEAKDALKTARDLFTSKGRKEDADRAQMYHDMAANAQALNSELTAWDEQFLDSLSSESLQELHDRAVDIYMPLAKLMKSFKKEQLPGDVRELMIAKLECFLALGEALLFREVDLKQLAHARSIFEKWQLHTLVIATNSLDNFIRSLRKYDSLQQIPKEVEEVLLKLLGAWSVLDGKLTDEISAKYRGEPFGVERGMAREVPAIVHRHIADTEKDWVRFCLVQLDFSIVPKPPAEEYGFALKEEHKVKTKVFKALNLAKQNEVDLICYPELSFAKEWVKEIENQYKQMIIVGGSYYDDGYNLCPIIIDGGCVDPPYKKHQPSPFEDPQTTGRGMRSGNVLYILQTKLGRFSVLTCIDYTAQSYRLCRYDNKGLDFIINPCYDPNIHRFQHRCNSDCEDYDINVIQVNRAPQGGKYGGSCIIGKEHDIFLDKLTNEGFKPEDDIKYKLFELEGEAMVIVDLDIRMKAPPVTLPLGYGARIRISKDRCFKYQRGEWVPLSEK